MWKKLDEDLELYSGLLVLDLPVFLSIQERDQFGDIQYSIVLSQACDIESHFRALKKEEESGEYQGKGKLSNVLLCPVFDEEKFIMGEHLKDTYSLSFEKISSKEKDRIKNLHNERYHYLEGDGIIIPNLYIDFKHFFTVPVEYLIKINKNSKERYCLEHIFLTQLSDRFSHYLQRVAIP